MKRSFWRNCIALLGVSLLALAGGSAPVGAVDVDAALAGWAAQPFGKFVEGTYTILMQRDPDSLWDATGALAASYGVERFAETTDISLDALAETRRIETEILRLLRSVDRASLSIGEQVTYDAYESLLVERIDVGTYPLGDVCIGPAAYGVHNRQLELLNVLPIRDADDARDYVARLRSVATWMQQLLDVLHARASAGIVPTLDVLQRAVQDLTVGILQGDVREPDPLLTDAYIAFDERLRAIPGLGADQRLGLLDEAASAIRDSVLPAYRALRNALVQLHATATSDVGVGRFPDGDAYYKTLLLHYAGTGDSPAHLHALGLALIAQIEGELRAFAASRFGWPVDLPMAQLSARIDAAKASRPEGGMLQAEYEKLLASAEEALPTFFGRLPTSDLEWRVDPLGPPAWYESPPLDRSEPGTFVVSLENPTLGTMYDEAVLVHHETFPGHHLQFGVAADLVAPSFQRLPAVPVCGRHPFFQAFTEGWALYAQDLAEEMGLYDDNPVGNLWRLRLALTQVVRMVADTGMNALGWTWADAATYLEGILGVRQGPSVLLRYEAAPGQACGYAAGYAMILELRARAEERLGAAFDLRAFHDALLGNGALPLPVLEHAIDDWIERQLAGG